MRVFVCTLCGWQQIESTEEERKNTTRNDSLWLWLKVTKEFTKAKKSIFNRRIVSTNSTRIDRLASYWPKKTDNNRYTIIQRKINWAAQAVETQITNKRQLTGAQRMNSETKKKAVSLSLPHTVMQITQKSCCQRRMCGVPSSGRKFYQWYSHLSEKTTI